MNVNETDPALKSNGQIAYEAWNRASYGAACDQAPVVWPDLQPSIKAAWDDAAAAVVDACERKLKDAEAIVGFHDEENRDRIGADNSRIVIPNNDSP